MNTMYGVSISEAKKNDEPKLRKGFHPYFKQNIKNLIKNHKNVMLMHNVKSEWK